MEVAEVGGHTARVERASITVSHRDHEIIRNPRLPEFEIHIKCGSWRPWKLRKVKPLGVCQSMSMICHDFVQQTSIRLQLNPPADYDYYHNTTFC